MFDYHKASVNNIISDVIQLSNVDSVYLVNTF